LKKLHFFINVLARPLRYAKRGLPDVSAGFVETHSSFSLGNWDLRCDVSILHFCGWQCDTGLES
jgi:hypothetical protein